MIEIACRYCHEGDPRKGHRGRRRHVPVMALAHFSVPPSEQDNVFFEVSGEPRWWFEEIADSRSAMSAFGTVAYDEQVVAAASALGHFSNEDVPEMSERQALKTRAKARTGIELGEGTRGVHLSCRSCGRRPALNRVELVKAVELAQRAGITRIYR